VAEPKMQLPEVFESLRTRIVALGSRLVTTVPGASPKFPTILGTGFLVDRRGIVATNNHVAQALRKLPKHPVTGASAAVALLSSNVEKSDDMRTMGLVFTDIKAYSLPESFKASGPFYGQSLPDVAFIRLNVREVPTVSLLSAPNSLVLGMRVATAGYSLGTDPLVAYGEVTQLTPLLREGIVSSLYPFQSPSPHGFTMDIMTQGGASGSPVFLTDNPTVVGIVHAGFPGTNITIAIPSSLIEVGLTATLENSKWDETGVPTLESIIQ
jgi:hypothetical protein